MKAKVYKRSRQNIPLPVGLHMVVITDMGMAKDNGKFKLDFQKNGYVRVKFKSEHGIKFEYDFSLNPKCVFILDNIRKTLGVYSETKQSEKSEIIKKPFYLIVTAKVLFNEHNEIQRSLNGDIVYEKGLYSKFYSATSRPAISGDPMRHQYGVPGGVFLEEPQIDLTEFMDESKDYEFWLKETKRFQYKEETVNDDF